MYEVYQATDINTALDILEFKITRALNIVAPMRRVTTRPHYAKWLTPALQIKIKRRNVMRKRAETLRKREDWSVFKAYQKVLAKELWDARLTSFKCDMDERDAKKRWKVVKQHAGLPSKTGRTTLSWSLTGRRSLIP